MINTSKHPSDSERQKVLMHMNSDAYRFAIVKEFQKLGLKAKRTGTKALLMGGGIFLIYFIGNRLINPRKNYVKVINRRGEMMVKDAKKSDSFLVTMIKEQIALFIFTMVKEKIKVFLKSPKKFSSQLLEKLK